MISNEKTILEFAELIGMENGVFQIYLCQRSKYKDEIKSKHIRTEICNHVQPEKLIKIIKSLEPFIDHPEASVLYCTTNPRCSKKALRKFISQLTTTIFDDNQDFMDNIDREWSSTLMASKGKHKFTTIDIDDASLYNDIHKIFEENKVSYHKVVTKNGYHLLFENNTIIPKLLKFNQHIGDIACPIPGTLQGGTEVKLSSLSLHTA